MALVPSGSFGTWSPVSDAALKILDSPFPQSVQDNFIRGAQILTEFKHPNAVIVNDIGFVGGIPYIEMEYLEGQTLREWLKAGEHVPLEKVVWFLGELCEVLGEFHKLGIVHRDIKPENIMIFTDPDSGRERVKLLDFGIAKMIHDESTLDHDTIAGTPNYMSPEQIRPGMRLGSEKHELDGRSDLYSTGVVLYQLLTGTLPFRGPMWAVMAAHLNSPPLSMKEANPKAEDSPPGRAGGLALPKEEARGQAPVCPRTRRGVPQSGRGVRSPDAR